jgi:hypothetical protein
MPDVDEFWILCNVCGCQQYGTMDRKKGGYAVGGICPECGGQNQTVNMNAGQPPEGWDRDKPIHPLSC